MLDLDLFSGARGWEAITHADVNAVGIELDRYACKTSEAAGFATYNLDIAAIDPRIEFGSIRGLIASPPCQTFSTQGRGAGTRAMSDILMATKHLTATGQWPAELVAGFDDPRTGLVLEPLRYALALEPLWIAWEQVPTVLPVWNACAEALRALGYRVVTGILNAEQYGVPQTRRRAVLLAHQSRDVQLPSPTHSRYNTRSPYALESGVAPWRSIRDALGERINDLGDARLAGSDQASTIIRARSLDKPAPTIPARAVGFYPDDIVLRGSTMPNCGKRHLDQPAPTVCASPTAYFSASKANKERIRMLTEQEAALLQTFPVDYPFQGPQSARYRQIGNAVPPLLGDAILREVAG